MFCKHMYCSFVPMCRHICFLNNNSFLSSSKRLLVDSPTSALCSWRRYSPPLLGIFCPPRDMSFRAMTMLKFVHRTPTNAAQGSDTGDLFWSFKGYMMLPASFRRFVTPGFARVCCPPHAHYVLVYCCIRVVEIRGLIFHLYCASILQATT